MKEWTNKQAKRWAATQRTKSKEGKLSDKEIQSLDSIGFIWEISPDYVWNDKFKALSNLDDPNVGDSHKLGRWVMYQRARYRMGKLHTDRVEKLEQIGFVWEIEKHHWDCNFNKVSELNDINVTKDHECGDWLNTQRAGYKKGELSEDRIKLLESVGIIWNPKEHYWNTNFETLSKFENPNIDVYDTQLGQWLRGQCKAYQKGLLPDDKIKMFEGIGVVWNTKPKRGFHKIEDLHKLAKGKGGKCLATKYESNKTSETWECSEGHQWTASWGNVIKGTWCSRCNGIPIVQLESDGSFIAGHISSASCESLGFTGSNIIRCCKGKAELYKGFKWMYKEDYDKLK